METIEPNLTPEHLADSLAAVAADADALEGKSFLATTSANEATAEAWGTTPGMVGLARTFVGMGRHQTVTIAALGLSEGNEALLALGRKYGERSNVRH